jgi:hypothetical protein
MDSLLMVAYGIASSFILGAFKKYTGLLDTAAGVILKPIQPLIVLGLTAVLPLAVGVFHLHDIPSATVIASAPVSAILAIVLREIAVRLKPADPVTPKTAP